jgi:hypothetical protein
MINVKIKVFAVWRGKQIACIANRFLFLEKIWMFGNRIAAKIKTKNMISLMALWTFPIKLSFLLLIL